MYSRFITVLCLFFSLGLVTLVSALPPNLAIRQAASVTVPAALASPTSITTTNTVQTVNGTMTETCVFTFTPVGQQIQEIRNCTLAMGGFQVSSTLVAATSTASPTAAAAFVLPGTTLQVLPVGLGVYGGITAIGVFVIAFGTWQRIQCRKAFRRQSTVENSSIVAAYGGVTKGDFNFSN